MSAFWGKADMALCESPLLRTLLGGEADMTCCGICLLLTQSVQRLVPRDRRVASACWPLGTLNANRAASSRRGWHILICGRKLIFRLNDGSAKWLSLARNRAQHPRQGRTGGGKCDD
jgi:hypothetical protein